MFFFISVLLLKCLNDCSSSFCAEVGLNSLSSFSQFQAMLYNLVNRSPESHLINAVLIFFVHVLVPVCLVLSSRTIRDQLVQNSLLLLLNCLHHFSVNEGLIDAWVYCVCVYRPDELQLKWCMFKYKNNIQIKEHGEMKQTDKYDISFPAWTKETQLDESCSEDRNTTQEAEKNRKPFKPNYCMRNVF